MMTNSLLKLFTRDLEKLTQEVNLYSNEADLWKLGGEIKNTAGNLTLHLCGNLQHFVGHVLGGSSYVRDRDHEFAAKNIARSVLLSQIDATITAVKSTLDKLSDQDLEADYPLPVFGYTMTTGYFLLHLSGHLTYHLGQINYHRRLLAG